MTLIRYAGYDPHEIRLPFDPPKRRLTPRRPKPAPCDGTLVIPTICCEHQVTQGEFFGPMQNRKVVEARRAAIEALRAKGLSLMACARLMKRDRETIRYWCNSDARAQRRLRNLKRSRKSGRVEVRV